MGRPEKLKDSLPGLLRIFRRFWPQIRKQRFPLSGATFAMFAAIPLRLLEPWPLALVVDYVISDKKAASFAGIELPETLDAETLLWILPLSFVVITVLRAVADYASRVGFAVVGNRVLTSIRDQVFRHLQTLSLSYHAKARSGDLVIRVVSDINLLKEVAITAVMPLIASVLVLVCMVTVLFWLHPTLALMSIAILPLYLLSSVRLGRRIHQAARRQRRCEGALAANAVESISAVKVIQSLSLENIFAAAFSKRSQKTYKESVRTTRLTARLEWSVQTLIAISTALVLWYGARSVLARELTLGELVVFLTYLKRSLRPLQDSAKYTARLAKAAAGGERILEILDRVPDVRDVRGAIEAPAFRGRVGFEQLSFAYNAGEAMVLDRVDWEIPAGRHVALVGASGIGKSTLISLILRLYDPDEGRVTIDGSDIRDFTLASLRNQMGVVLQDSVLFAASVRDNIAYGAPEATLEEIQAAARLANADEFIRALPDGYDTEVAERGVTFSHGERQRIAIARAAIRNAPILLLDEPTTGLDEKNERAVMQALKRLAQDRTTFLVTHKLQYAADADVICYLDGGQIVESGSHAELMQADGRYAAQYRLQTPNGAPVSPKVLLISGE